MPDKVVQPEVPYEVEKSCIDGLQSQKIDDKEGCRHPLIVQAYHRKSSDSSILEVPQSKIHDSSTSPNIHEMKATGEADLGSLSEKIKPPRLEDACLEDCALPPDSIHEAFVKAATTVHSQIFQDSDDESQGDCINDPWHVHGSSSDILAGIMTRADPTNSCAPRKGEELTEATGDVVVTGGREDMPDKVVQSEV
ncbi:hypothetical protein L2E82_52213 [Cichorium intybus]|nr:hypothetical protein L2E82_52213 [Cichorium intybus]